MPDAIPVPQNFDLPAVQAGVLSAKGIALRAIAAGGSQALQMATENQAAQSQFANSAAMQAAANAGSITGPGAPAGFAQEQAATASAGFAPLMQAAAMQGQAGQQFTGLLSQANENYGNQVSQATPLVHQQTQRELNSLTSRAREASADRAQARALADLQMRNSREDRAASSEANKISLERARLGLEGDKLSYNAQLDAAREKALGSGGLTDNDLRAVEANVNKTTDQVRSAYGRSMVEATGSQVDDKGKVVPSEGMKALNDMIQNGLSIDEALAKYKTPGGNQLSRDALLRWYADYESTLSRQLSAVSGYSVYRRALSGPSSTVSEHQ